MAANGKEYTIPLSIDPSGFLTGLDAMEAGLTEITAKAKGASSSITEAMTASNKAGDALVTKMNQGAQAAKNLSDAAKTAGVDLNKTFSADNIKTTGLEKVSQFITTLRDKAGKPVDFKFNVDQAGVKALVDKLGKAKSEMEGFNLILGSAKERLAGLTAGTPAFQQLENQIKIADEFVKKLTLDVDGLKDEINEPLSPEGLPKVGDEAENTVAKVIPLRQQIRLMKEELAQMELAGKGGTAEFIELSKRAGELSDQFQDTSQRVKNLASDTKGLDAGITAIRGLAGAFAVGQGALAAFGETNEEAAKAIQKVQGALAILQGVQEVANVLNKDSALVVYLNTFARKANTTAIVAETAAVEAETVATVSATAATRAWTVALLANPITALIAILAVAVAAVYAFAKAQKESGLNAEQLNKILERQQSLLDEDLARSKQREQIRTAINDRERKNQSETLELRRNALIEQKKANQIEFEETSRRLTQLNASDKDYEKNKEAIYKRLEDLEIKRVQFNTDIFVATQQLLKQRNEEEIKLRLEYLKERQEQLSYEAAIQTKATEYLNQIQASKIAELKDGQEKELQILRNSLSEKLQQLNQESQQNLKALEDKKKQLQLEVLIADENEKKIIGVQLSNLEKQIELEKDNGQKRIELSRQLTEAELIEENKIREKYAQEKADIEFEAARTLISIQKESATKQIDLINLVAQHEADVIERSNQDTITKNIQLDALEEKRLKDIADAKLEYRLNEIEVEKVSNENLLMEQKGFFDRSRDAQALANYLLAKNQLEADEKKLEALKAAGKKAGDQEYENAKNAVLRSKAGVDEAAKSVPKQSIFELLFPNDAKGQKLAEDFVKSLDQAGKAVDAFISLQIAAQQRKIDAQKKAVDADEAEIERLQERLKEEESLRDKGYANNVDDIKKLLSEKNKQREEDIRKADEYQKKMAKIQKAQITAQTILQAVQLATAGTNILLQSTAEGGAIGAIIGILSVAGMIGAFVAQKKAAYDAVNTETSSFGGGGIIKGKSHAQGGQKYYAPDATGGIMELEEGEQVINKKQTEKYGPLLKAVNDDKLKDMDDKMIFKLLDGLGVHLQTDKQHKEALRESREHTTNQVNQITIEATSSKTPKELVNIDNTLTRMASRNNDQVMTWEENGYNVTKKGNQVKKVRKH